MFKILQTGINLGNYEIKTKWKINSALRVKSIEDVIKALVLKNK
jgi:hypothetical protein